MAVLLGVGCQLRAGGEDGAGAQAAVQPSVIEQLQAALPEQHVPELDQLLQKSLSGAPGVRIAEWAAAMAMEDAKAERAPMLPNLAASASVGVTYEQRQDYADADRTIQAVLYNVGLNQPVFHWGALKNNYEIAKLRKAVAERNVGEARRLMAVDMRRRYFDLILMAGSLDIARKNLERYRRDFEETQQLIKDGMLAAGNLDGPNRNIQITQPEVQRLENEYAVLKRSVIQIAGLPEGSLDNLPKEVPPLPDIEASLVALAGSADAPLDASVRLENLNDEVRMAQLRYTINRTRLLPKLGVNLSVNQDNRTPDNNVLGPKSLVTSWNAFATVSWNIFDGFGSQAITRSSLNQLRLLETNRVQVEQQESNERKAEVERLLIQWHQLQNTELDLRRTRGGVELVESDFASGQTSPRAVEDMRMSLSNATLATYGARAAFYTALATCLSNRGADPVPTHGMRN